jgi:hypothetical protein
MPKLIRSKTEEILKEETSKFSLSKSSCDWILIMIVSVFLFIFNLK